MNDIISEFNGSTEHIKNNFYLSFLSVNFIDQKPFFEDIILDVIPAQYVLKANSINDCDLDVINEYGNSIRRHFLNDIVIAYERYAMLMIASHIHTQIRTEPAILNNRQLGAHIFEQLPNLFSQSNLQFLIQLRRLRNSIVHYNGHYSATNELNYTFGNNNYNSTGFEGEKISIEFDSLIWIYDELKRIVCEGNTNYFIYNPLPD